MDNDQGPIILCGLGSLGTRIYDQLTALGLRVVLVDPTPDPVFVRRVGHAAHILSDDPRLPAVLETAGLAEACALITTFDDDLINLEIVLAATRARPGLRVVMRFFNIDLAAQMESALPNLAVFSLSALAAPAFVAAATSPTTQATMIMDEQVISMAEIVVAAPARVGDYGAVLPVAARVGSGAPTLFPPPDQSLGPGDRLTVLGAAAAVRAASGAAGGGVARRHRPHRDRPGTLATFFRRLDPALYGTLAVLALVIAVSVAIFADARHLKFLDALELVLGVVSSTGLGWVADSNEPGWLTLYTIGLMIVGTVAVTVLYAFITNYIVSVKLSGLLGQQPVTLRDHVVVCGLGTVGYRVAKGLLDQGEQVAVLERDAGNRFVPLIRAERHARVVIADAR
ncbi:MAG TPA: NAD-binding protein, partial [Chloroflexia bacterium]|nr:NAD-binding protein [Chloroflexia bacterium]